MSAVLLLIVVFVLAMILLYFAGFIPGSVPQRYKQMFELADMSEEDASSFMDKICEDPDDIENYNETLLNIVRTVQRKDKEDESSNAQRLRTLGRGNCSTGNSFLQPVIDSSCVMGDWRYGECIPNDTTCQMDGMIDGMQTRTRAKFSGNCTADIETYNGHPCKIVCSETEAAAAEEEAAAAEAEAERLSSGCSLENEWCVTPNDTSTSACCDINEEGMEVDLFCNLAERGSYSGGAKCTAVTADNTGQAEAQKKADLEADRVRSGCKLEYEWCFTPDDNMRYACCDINEEGIDVDLHCTLTEGYPIAPGITKVGGRCTKK